MERFGLSKVDLHDPLNDIFRKSGFYAKDLRIAPLDSHLKPDCGPIEKGTKSHTVKLDVDFLQSVHGLPIVGKTVRRSFLLKRYKSGTVGRLSTRTPEERFKREKAVMSVAQERVPPMPYLFSGGREIKLFPFLYSYAYRPFDSLLLLLEEYVEGGSFHVRLNKRIERGESVSFEDVEHEMDPHVLLHGELILYKSEIERRAGHKLERLSAEDIAERSAKDLEVLVRWRGRELKPEGRAKWKEANYHLYRELCEKPADAWESLLRGLIQHDSWPEHVMPNCLIDAGSVREGNCMDIFQLLFLDFVHPGIPPNEYAEKTTEAYLARRLLHAEEGMMRIIIARSHPGRQICEIPIRYLEAVFLGVMHKRQLLIQRFYGDRYDQKIRALISKI